MHPPRVSFRSVPKEASGRSTARSLGVRLSQPASCHFLIQGSRGSISTARIGSFCEGVREWCSVYTHWDSLTLSSSIRTTSSTDFSSRAKNAPCARGSRPSYLPQPGLGKDGSWQQWSSLRHQPASPPKIRRSCRRREPPRSSRRESCLCLSGCESSQSPRLLHQESLDRLR